MARHDEESASDWGLRLLDNFTARHQCSAGVRVESFLQEVVGLESEPEVVLDLLVAEWMLRRQAGEVVELSEYVGRFPNLEHELRMLWAVDQQTPFPPGEPGLTADMARSFPDWYLGAAALPVAFGSYRLLREFGGGGMARVFLAEPMAGGSLVALKVPKLPLEQDSESIADREKREIRFLREAHLTQRLDHPSLCRTLDVGECQRLPYFTMPYYSQGSVAEELRASGTFSQTHAARLIATVARAMQHAHDLGMIHRDLKPSNLLRADDGQIVVTDFGLAFMVELEGFRLTSSGHILGTPRYFSPEQAGGERKLTPATDIFSLGVILYELLAGQVPFEGNNVALLRAIHEASPRPLEELRQDVSPALAAICRKAMAKEPGERYSSMTAFADDLDRFLAGTWTLGSEPPEPQTPSSTDPGPTEHCWHGRRWVAVLCLGLLGSIVGLGLWGSLAGNIWPFSHRGGNGEAIERVLVSTRQPIGQRGLLQLLHDDLDHLEAIVRPHIRYFSLMAVHDNPYISDADFALHLDALRRVLNRLSHNKLDVPVYPVDASGCLLRIDLRDLDWDAAYEWLDLLDAEPYGVRYDSTVTSDETLRKLAREIYALTASLDSPIVRADWFIEAAMRSPLFDRLQRTAGNDRRTAPFDLTAAADPIARVVRLYQTNTVDARVAAAELGLGTVAVLDSRWPPDKRDVRKAIEESLPRSRWAGEGGHALFADCARALKLGVPRTTQPLH